jgi:O-antigen ligase
VLFYFLISKVTDSFQLIEKQLNIFLIPCLITALALLVSYFGGVSGLNTGFLQKVWAEGPRAMAFFKDPNVAGPFLILPGIYSFARILNNKGKGNSLYFWMFVLSCVGIIVTLSRAAILCMLFSAIVTLIISADQKKVFKIISMLFISILVISASFLYLPKSGVFSRIQDTEFGVQSRAERIEKGIAAFKKSPLIGSGMEQRMRNEAPHDSYFLLLSQIGLFGFLAFWIPVSYLSLKLLSASKNKKNAENKIVLITLGATLSSYALFGIVIYFLHWRHFWYIAGLSAAAVQLLQKGQKPATTQSFG